MKHTILVEKEVEITHIRIQVAVRYDEEDIPDDFPMRSGDVWDARVNIDTGQIEDWPKGKSGRLSMKVCDEGTYTLYSYFGDHWDEITKLENEYVPNRVVPGEYGDYIDLDIDENGIIKNWFREPDVSAFFKTGEE